MAPSSDSRQLTRRNFADGIRSAFHGPYATNSLEYHMSTTFAAQPPIYDRTLICFRFKRDVGPNFFIVGSPVTITYEPLYVQHRGRALYGLIRRVDDTLDTVHWPGTICRMIVEVHCIPNFLINWDYAVPWVVPPHGAVFIQPHGFISDEYRPRSLLATPLHEVIRLPLRTLPWPDFHDFQLRLWEVPRRVHLPAPHEYTQHPADDDDYTVPWIPPTMPVTYMQPHSFLPPDVSLSPVSSPQPSSDDGSQHHIDIAETASTTARETSDEGSADGEAHEWEEESAVEAIYQLEANIAGDELDVDQEPPVSLSSTPDSMPELRLINDADGPWVFGTSSSAPPVSPALFSVMTANPPGTDIEPPAYADLPPHVITSHLCCGRFHLSFLLPSTLSRCPSIARPPQQFRLQHYLHPCSVLRLQTRKHPAILRVYTLMRHVLKSHFCTSPPGFRSSSLPLLSFT